MKPNKLKMSVVAAFAAAALLLGGCTSGNTPSPSPSQTSTTATASASATGSPTPSPTQASGAQSDNGQQPNAATANCAADSVQVPGSHGSYGEVDATFEPAVDALVASGTSHEEAIRQTLVAHAKNNVQRLAIWSFGLNLWADPNNTADLQKDGCLSSEGQTLWQKYADAMSGATITMGNAPLDGTDSGVINDKYVVADHPGINGSTEAATVALSNGVRKIVSKWCGNLVFMAVKPVIPKSPQITQHRTQQYTFVCDTVTKTDNVQVTVEEAANARYVAVGNIACKPQPPNVQRCDSKTKADNVTVSEEAAKDTDRYKPVGDVACKPVEVIKACIKGSGDQTLKPVDKFDDKTMSKNPADCVKPPKDVQRCDSKTGTDNVTISEEAAKDTDRYKPVGDVACHPVETIKVCIKGSGDQTLKPINKEDFDSATMSTDVKDCVKPPCDCHPPVKVWRCDISNPNDWKWVSVTPEQAKDTTQYSDVPEVDCVTLVVCVKENHPQPGSDWTWDETTCKWCPPAIVPCPEGQTPNPQNPKECLNLKDTDPSKFPHEEGAPLAVADKTPSAPGLDHTTTETGGRGDTVIDTPTTTDATAPSGVTAPVADAPNSTPPTQVNEGGATESNGSNSGTVTSNPIDAPTIVAPAPAVNDQAAAAAAQAAADQAAKDAANVAAVQAARAQAQAAQAPAVAVQQTQTAQASAPAVAKTVTTKAAAPASAKAAPAAAPTTTTTEVGAPMISVTTPAAPAASVGG